MTKGEWIALAAVVAVLLGAVVTAGLWTAGVVVDRMDRIEGKLDQQAEKMNALKVDVEVIKQHQRFQSAIMADDGNASAENRIHLILSAIEGK